MEGNGGEQNLNNKIQIALPLLPSSENTRESVGKETFVLIHSHPLCFFPVVFFVPVRTGCGESLIFFFFEIFFISFSKCVSNLK